MKKNSKHHTPQPTPKNWPTDMPYDRKHNDLTCANDSIHVGAILLYAVSIATNKEPTAIGYLTNDQLWHLFKGSHKSGLIHYPNELPSDLFNQLTTGEKLAIEFGLQYNSERLPHGSCIGDILNSAAPGLLPTSLGFGACNQLQKTITPNEQS